MGKGKTRKAVLKRLKITRRGKVLARRIGQNHFLAKQSRTKKLRKKALAPFNIKAKQLANYLN